MISALHLWMDVLLRVDDGWPQEACDMPSCTVTTCRSKTRLSYNVLSDTQLHLGVCCCRALIIQPLTETRPMHHSAARTTLSTLHSQCLDSGLHSLHFQGISRIILWSGFIWHTHTHTHTILTCREIMQATEAPLFFLSPWTFTQIKCQMCSWCQVICGRCGQWWPATFWSDWCWISRIFRIILPGQINLLIWLFVPVCLQSSRPAGMTDHFALQRRKAKVSSCDLLAASCHHLWVTDIKQNCISNVQLQWEPIIKL